MRAIIVNADGSVIYGDLLETSDDTTRTVTTYDEQGNITSERPYTAEENAAADQAALEATLNTNKRTVEQKLATKLGNMQTILDQTNADLRTDPSQEIKDLARAVRLLTHLQLNQYDGVD